MRDREGGGLGGYPGGSDGWELRAGRTGLCQMNDELGSSDVFVSVSLQVCLVCHTCSLV